MNSLIKYLLILLSCALCTTAFAQSNYVPNTLIVKVKPALRGQCTALNISNANFGLACNNLQVTSITQLFSKSKAAKDWDNKCTNCVDISLIYELKLTTNLPLHKAIAQLMASNTLIYAELKHTHQVQYTPNDPFKSNQYYITDSTRMSLYKAWNVTKGDTNTVIGIVDTGSDWAHEDLSANVKNNYNDPINGIDDDFDGYIDNFRGWDMFDNDNNPLGQNGHGTLCAGIAAAVTNNNKGISGVGFNCKFLPVKIANAQGNLGHEYEGVVYAADHGCSVINCSWGGAGATSQYGHDIIKYATYNRNALVIGAAGNNGNEKEFYPASYDEVISVANVDDTDHKFTGSTYNYKVDVSAPGTAMYTTFIGNGYGGNGVGGFATGTSFAAPAVAGVAGLVRSYFPTDDAATIAQRIKASADNIYGINFQYFDKLGTGRVNAHKALTQNDAWLVFTRKQITTNALGNYTTNDTLNITFTLKNYIAAANTIVVSASSTSPYLQALNTTYNYATAMVNDTFGNGSGVPIQFKIIGNVPYNTVVPIKLEVFANGKLSGNEVFITTINPDYLTIKNNAITTTITSKGTNGYTNGSVHNGEGLLYNNTNVLYESSFMISNKWQQAADGFRNNATNDTDFVRLNAVKYIPSVDANYTQYKTTYTTINGLVMRVCEQTLLPTLTTNNEYVIKRYTLTNTNNANATNVYAGIITDWDIDNALNKGATVANKKLSYTFSPVTQAAAGTKLLSATPSFNSYHIDNVNGGAGGINIGTPQGFYDSLKYVALSTNRLSAGTATAQGNDVLQCTSVGPFNINAGDSITLDFALLLSTLQDIETLGDTVQAHYNKLVNVNSVRNNFSNATIQVYPNPAHTTLHINNYTLNNIKTIAVIDVLGNTHICNVTNQTIDIAMLTNGMYYVQINDAYIKFIKE
jgi:serine protease